MWRCRFVKRGLAAYQDGQLRGRRLQYTERHLDRCARCRAELEELRRVTHLLRALPPPSRPQTYWPLAIQRLHEKLQELPRANAGPRWLDAVSGVLENPMRALVPVTLVGAVLLVTVVAFDLEEAVVTLFSAYVLPLVLD